jgi:predicted neutral ceramidase superfamily lipid hydrolase
MVQLLQQLYGDDILNIALKIIFEFFSYLLAGMIGAVLRELIIERKRSCCRAIASSIVVAVILFSTSNYLLKKIGDGNLVFGLAVLLGVYLPSFLDAIKSGRILKYLIRLFSERGYKIMKDLEEEERSLKKDSSPNEETEA